MTLLTLKETAERLRLNERAVSNLIKRGVLPGCKLGKSYRIDEKDLENLIKSKSKLRED